MKQTLCITLLLSGLSAARAGEYAADFIHLGTGAEGAAMGGAFSTSKASATSFYWNPALVLDDQKIKLYGETVNLFEGLAAYHTGALQVRLRERWALSAGAQVQMIDEIPRYGELDEDRDLNNPEDRSDGLAEDYFESNALAATVGLSREFWFDFLLGQGVRRNRLPARLAVGAAWRMINQDLDDASASGSGMDLGLKLMVRLPRSRNPEFERELVFGFCRQNLISQDLEWDTASGHADPLPGNTRTGLSYKDAFPRLLLDWRLALEFASAYEGTWHLGTELGYRRLVFLRAGLQGESFENATFGAGIRFQHMLINYAYLAHDLGATHRVGVELRL